MRYGNDGYMSTTDRDHEGIGGAGEGGTNGNQPSPSPRVAIIRWKKQGYAN